MLQRLWLLQLGTLLLVVYQVLSAAASDVTLLQALWSMLAIVGTCALFLQARRRMSPKSRLRRGLAQARSLFVASGVVALIHILLDYIQIIDVQVLLGLLLAVSAVRSTQGLMNIGLVRELKPTTVRGASRPNVTLAIPARNETLELTRTLMSVTKQSYEKLEILVLDDCSQGKTAEIIRGFAHDGVRFLEGTPPPDTTWMPKNWAYQQLLEEANGDYICFAGADIAMNEASIESFVATMEADELDLLSVTPKRQHDALIDIVFSPLRYLKLLAGFDTMPHARAISSAWIVHRNLLATSGFYEVRRRVDPEVSFARLARKRRGARLMTGHNMLIAQKGPAEQRSTAIRTLYPLARKRFDILLYRSALLLIWAVVPYVVFVIALFWANYLLGLAATASILLMNLLSALAHTKTYDGFSVFAACLGLPIQVLTDMAYGLASFYRYEFSTVDWKGRNVCLPVMHMEPRLPALNDT